MSYLVGSVVGGGNESKPPDMIVEDNEDDFPSPETIDKLPDMKLISRQSMGPPVLRANISYEDEI